MHSWNAFFLKKGGGYVRENIKEKVKLIPEKPGCYLMKDIKNTIIYVGKAKNLKRRVSSYFVGAHNTKTTLLVSEIVDFEYIVTNSEVESLILEMNLIKNHLPKYNIKLVDDASYPYILLTIERYPRLMVVREKINKKKGKYFGPYPSAAAARKTATLLNKIYPFRKCHKIPNKECLYYHIGQCLAPCIKPNVNYQDEIDKVTNFLKGNVKEVLKHLEEKMFKASELLEFEKALEYKNLINDVNLIIERQNISSLDFEPKDVFGVYVSSIDISIEVLYLRGGSIVANYKTIIPLIGDIEEALTQFIYQFYENEAIRPKEVIIDNVVNNEILTELLNINITTPQKGRKKELLVMAENNAKINYENNRKLYENKIVKKQENIYKLGDLLGIKPPIRIEAFDNSNLFGEYPVSAMVCYINGIKSPKDYRKYHVNSVVGANDYATMKEIVYRRYYRLLMENKSMPDLIIMDGGVIQVNACKEILESLNLDINVLGLKKDDNHKTNVIYFEGETYELSKNDDLYLFLSNIQETVHEFAISFFRNTKAKGMFLSRLDGIKGLGPKKKEALLKKFITIDKIKSLSIEEFQEVGINKELAAKILNHLNKEQN